MNEQKLLSTTDAQAMRERHQKDLGPLAGRTGPAWHCLRCDSPWPCEVRQLLDYIEWLENYVRELERLKPWGS